MTMKKYDCYKAEPDTTPSGKALKKLVLQEEGKPFPIKNVTIWANHPLFEDMVAGWSGNLEISEKDSGTPNPKAPGKNYINRTVIDPSFQRTEAPATPKPTTLARDTNVLDFQVVPLLKEIKAMVGALSDRLDVFIDADGIQPKFDKPKTDDVDDSSPF